jgi:1-acyl-sn-glycerol-3-phosphate acyltransferase
MAAEVVPDYSEATNPETYRKSVERTGKVVRAIWGLNITDRKNIPMEGPALIAFAHESLIDLWILGIITPRAVKGMAKEELLRWYYFGLGSRYLANRDMFFVNRADNTSKKAAYESSLDAGREGRALVMAPEGTHHKKERGVIGETKNGVGRIVTKLASEGIDCPVIPMVMTTDRQLLMQRRPIESIVGRPIRVDADVATVRQRNVAADDINENVRSSLQVMYDQAMDLRSLRHAQAKD